MTPIARTVRRPGLVAGLVLCIACGFLRPAGGAPPGGPPGAGAVMPLPFPDGVTDPERKTAFIISPKGGVQAIQLTDGMVLWTNDEVAGRPWLVAGGRLVVRDQRLTILDIRDGKLLRKCDAPAYPKVEIPDKCTVSFELWNPRATGAALEANWYAVAAIDRSKGRPFAFEAWTAFNRSVPVGTVTFDLDSGRADIRPDPKPADVTAGLVPEAATPIRRVPAGLPEKLTAVWSKYHKDQDSRVAVVGERLVGVSLVVEPAGKEFVKRVVLHAWDLKTGAPAEPVELVKDKAIALANVVLTADRRHAGVVSSTSALSVYSLADGTCIAQGVKGVLSPDSAVVDGGRLYSAESTGAGGGRQLRAIDLKTGTQVWERPLRPGSTIPLPP